MSYLVLARKWRPTRFEEVVGQEEVVRTLQNAIRLDRVGHAYLFCGVRGVGKTTVARLLAKALNCEQGPTPEPDDTCSHCTEINQGRSADVVEIDGASNTGVDDVRTLRENVRYLPSSSRYKIYIIDEVHMLSTSAFNALLKTLEEPPAHVKFIFATTEPHKIPVTVTSRCQRFDFKRIPAAEIAEQLKRIFEAEGAKADEEAIRILAREAAGSMRDALSLADQALAFAGDELEASMVADALGIEPESIYPELIEHALEGRVQPMMGVVERIHRLGRDTKRFMTGLVWNLRHLVLYGSLGEKAHEFVEATQELRGRLLELSQRTDSLRWQQMLDVASRGLEQLAYHPVPRLVLESTLLRLANLQRLLPIERLIRVIESGGTAQGGGTTGGGGNRPAATTRERPRAHGGPMGGQNAAGQWEQLVQKVCENKPSIGAILEHVVPLDVSAGQVRISIQGNEFFGKQLEEERNRRLLEQIFTDHFGTPTRLKVEREAAGGESLAGTKKKQEEMRRRNLEQKSISHPVVQQAIKIFGAEVEKVNPLGKAEE